MLKQYEVATLKKGLIILDGLQNQDMTLQDVIQTFSFNKSTAFRLLYTLEMMGYIKKVNHYYSLTNKMASLSTSYSIKTTWLSVPPLQQLSQEVGETSYVGILYGTNVITAQVIDGPHSIRAHSEVGDQAPVHLSALGKVILAFLDEKKLEGVLKDLELIQQTKNSFVDLHLLKEHLKVIRMQGYAIDDEETEVGLRCIAAPILTDEGVIAAIAISGPTARLPKKMDKSLSKKIIQCSSYVSNMLS